MGLKNKDFQSIIDAENRRGQIHRPPESIGQIARKCPTHNVRLVHQDRKPFGLRWYCPEPGCPIACLDRVTSTPADGLTRKLRIHCHDEFDRLWKSREMSREDAYLWLRIALNLKKDDAHIGNLNAAQCTKLLACLADRQKTKPVERRWRFSRVPTALEPIEETTLPPLGLS